MQMRMIHKGYYMGGNSMQLFLHIIFLCLYFSVVVPSWAQPKAPERDSWLSDSTFYEKSFPVFFPVNRYNIPENEQDSLKSVFGNRVYDEAKFRITGAASPEGPYLNNVFLGKQRAAALRNFFVGIGVAPDQILVEPVNEDYNHMLYLMWKAGDKDYLRVSNLYIRYGVNKAVFKQKLRQLDGGVVWKRLYRTYFPRLRSSRVMIVLPEKPAPEPEPVDTAVTPAPVEPKPAPDTVAVCPKPEVEPTPVPVDTTVSVLPAPVEVWKRRELLSVKTNLLMYGAYVPQYGWCPMPNVTLEYYPLHGHYTYGASFDFPWYRHRSTHKYFQLRNYQLFTRRYFKGDGEFRGWYVDGYAHMFLYGIGFNDHKGWQGEGVGAGVGGGYVLPLSRDQHWRLEFQLQAGWFWTKYDPYQYTCPVEGIDDNRYYYKWTGPSDLFKKRQYHFTWLGPTRIGITLSYDILYRKKVKVNPQTEGKK